MSSKKIIVAAALGLVGFAAVAFAQNIPPAAQVLSLNQNDLVQIIPRGQPAAQSKYTQPGTIGGLEQYSYRVPLTGFAITIPAHTSLMMINPAGTLATGAFTMEANPAMASVCAC